VVTSVLIFYLLLRSWMLGTPMGGYPAQWHVSPVRLVGRAAQLVFRSFFPPILVDVSGVYGAGLKPTPALIALGLIGAGVGLLGLLWVGRSVRRWRPEDRRAVIGLGDMWLTALIPVANLSINITDGQGDRFCSVAQMADDRFEWGSAGFWTVDRTACIGPRAGGSHWA
jgi:hypothetical protein